MKKRKIIKLGYKQIVKEKRSHQEVFDNLILDKTNSKKEVAALLSVIPSSAKQSQYATLRFFYIALLAVVFVLRVVVVLYLSSYHDDGIWIVVLGSLFSLIAPGLGIYAALFAKENFYRTAGTLFGLSIIRSIGKVDLSNMETLLSLGVILLAIGFSFYIPYKLKTNYTVEDEVVLINGAKSLKKTYVFEKEKNTFDDVLDSDMI